MAGDGFTVTEVDIERRRQVRNTTSTLLRRWNLRPSGCMVCGRTTRERLVVMHPDYAHPEASWLIVTAHLMCRRKIKAGLIAWPAPLDLHELEQVAQWFTGRDVTDAPPDLELLDRRLPVRRRRRRGRAR